MIGLDTNVLVRYIMQDDARQAMAQAAATPKIRFSGTAMAAAIKVKRIAAAAQLRAE